MIYIFRKTLIFIIILLRNEIIRNKIQENNIYYS
jgi:hypothetical protein